MCVLPTVDVGESPVRRERNLIGIKESVATNERVGKIGQSVEVADAKSQNGTTY